MSINKERKPSSRRLKLDLSGLQSPVLKNPLHTNLNLQSIYSNETKKVLNSTSKDLVDSARDKPSSESQISSIDPPDSSKTESVVKDQAGPRSSETLHNKYKDILRAKKEDSSDSCSSISSSSLSNLVSAISLIQSKNNQEPRSEDTAMWLQTARLERMKMMKPRFGRYGEESCLNDGDYIEDGVLHFECGSPDCFWMFAWTPGLEDLNRVIQVINFNFNRYETSFCHLLCILLLYKVSCKIYKRLIPPSI